VARKKTDNDNDNDEPDEVDVMADAPPPRPYAEAVTDEHKQVLREAGQAEFDQE